MGFKEIAIEDLSFNPFTMVGNEWTLVTAGNKNDYNTMTASWGHLGVIWNKNTAVTYIRPQRFTRQFVEKEEIYTLSVYDEKYREDLKFLGSVSGKDDRDKVKKTSLTPMEIENTMAFEEANIIFVCKKLYIGRIEGNNFLNEEIKNENYPLKDFHYTYISEILKVLVKE